MHTAIPAVAGVPIEFILFAAVLAGVAVFHHHSLRVALIGLAAGGVWYLLARDGNPPPGVEAISSLRELAALL